MDNRFHILYLKGTTVCANNPGPIVLVFEHKDLCDSCTYESLLKGVSEALYIIQAKVIALGFPPGLDGKTLLQKIPNILFAGTGKSS